MRTSAVIALSRRFELASETAAAVPKVEQRKRALRIGNLRLLVPHDSGGELLEDVRIHALPRTAHWCRGLINVRGQLVPAFDVHDSLGLAKSASARQWWLILGRGDDSVAFALDALPVTLTVNTRAVVQSAVIPEPLRPFVSAGYRVEDELWLDFDYRGYFRALAQRVAA